MDDGSTRLDLFEAALLARDKKCLRRGDTILAQCPSHDDREPSLSVGLSREGGVIFHCHAGCSGHDVIGALGLRWDQIKPDTYRGERRRNRQKDIDTDALIIEIARADRAAGKPISQRDKEREYQAFKNLRAKGKAVPEGAPTVVEILNEAYPGVSQ